MAAVCFDVKLLFLSLFLLYVYVNMYVYVPQILSPPPMRSETLIKHVRVDITSILTLFLLCLCLFALTLPTIDLNCRFITFDTRLNTLKVSTRTSRTENLHLTLLFILYLIIFEYFTIVFLPYEFFKIHPVFRRIVKKTFILVITLHFVVENNISVVSHRLTYLDLITILAFYQFPHEILAFWFLLLRLILCPDIHPNPGPVSSNNFSEGLFLQLVLKYS